MDRRLLAWGLQGGPRGRSRGGLRGRSAIPRLWLFTDDRRLPDPRDSVAALPRGRAGVVLRHDGDPARAELAQALARLCRERRLILVIAGDPRLAAQIGAGVHLRGGRWPVPLRPRGFVSSSAHSVMELHRAAHAGAVLVFLSPAFATASHQGAPGLGPLRWAAVARRAPAGLAVAALGGMDGGSVRRLPSRILRGAGAIGALSADAAGI